MDFSRDASWKNSPLINWTSRSRGSAFLDNLERDPRGSRRDRETALELFLSSSCIMYTSSIITVQEEQKVILLLKSDSNTANVLIKENEGFVLCWSWSCIALDLFRCARSQKIIARRRFGAACWKKIAFPGLYVVFKFTFPFMLWCTTNIKVFDGNAVQVLIRFLGTLRIDCGDVWSIIKSCPSLIRETQNEKKLRATFAVFEVWWKDDNPQREFVRRLHYLWCFLVAKRKLRILMEIDCCVMKLFRVSIFYWWKRNKWLE